MINENYILKFGKYKSNTIQDIYEKDLSYCQWLLRQPSIENYSEIKKFLEEKFIDPNECYLSFGKYKNKSISEIKKKDPKYIDYLKNNEYVKSKMKKLYENL